MDEAGGEEGAPHTASNVAVPLASALAHCRHACLLPSSPVQVAEHTDGTVSMVLLANKADMVDRRAVSDEEIAEIAKAHNVQVFYTSAKTGENVQEAFETVAKLATRRVLETKPKTPTAAAGAAGGAGTGGVDLAAGSKPGAKAGTTCCG